MAVNVPSQKPTEAMARGAMAPGRTGRFPRAAVCALLAAALAATTGFCQAVPEDAFGQNKLSYGRFRWHTYESSHFLVHYYDGEEALLPDVVAHAEASYDELSAFFQHEVKIRIPLVFYRSHAEFETTNVTTELLDEGIGAFSDPFQDRMVLPADLPPSKLRQLIQHELTHIFQFSFFFEHRIGRAMSSRLPPWAVEGMASYLAGDEDSVDRMVLRDAVLSGYTPPLSQLQHLDFLVYRIGHAAFDFMEQAYGPEKLRAFLLEYRRNLTSPLRKVVQKAYGEEIGDFDEKFRRWLNLRYVPEYVSRAEVWEQGREVRYPGRHRAEPHIFSPAASPSGELIAAITTRRGRADVALFSASGGGPVRMLTRRVGRAYDYLATDAYMGAQDLSWSASGDRLAFFVRKGKGRRLVVFNPLDGSHVASYRLEGLQRPSSPSFSPDGRAVAFSAIRGVQPDLFRLTLADGSVEALTNDSFFEQAPAWISGDEIVYASYVGPARKLMRLRVGSGKIEQLTFGDGDDIQPALSRDGRTLYFASDRDGGIFNIFTLDLASGEVRRRSNLFTGAFQPAPLALEPGGETYAFSALREGRFRLFIDGGGNPGVPGEAAQTVDDSVGAVPAELREPPPLSLPPISTADKHRGGETFPAPFDADEAAAAFLPNGGQDTLSEGAKHSYEAVFGLDGLRVAAGIASDGTVLTDAALSASDRVGNQRFAFEASSAQQFPQFRLSYANTSRRLHWGAGLLDERDFYHLFRDLGDSGRHLSRRLSGVRFSAEYPFSRFTRAEAAAGYYMRRQVLPLYAVDSAGAVTDAFRLVARQDVPIFELGLAGDTTGPGPSAPMRGRRFHLSASWAPGMGGTSYHTETVLGSGAPVPPGPDGGFHAFSLDFRNYLRLTPRMNLASRIFGGYSGGGVPQVFAFGGDDTMRGFPYRSVAGTRAFYLNQELRFPFVDRLEFPGGWGFDQIRGLLFWDLGAAWFEQDDFDFYRDGKLRDGVSSVGAGFSVALGGVEMVWDFAFRTDLAKIDRNARMSFWIGKAF